MHYSILFVTGSSRHQTADENVMDSVSTSSLSSCEIVVETITEPSTATTQQQPWEKFDDNDESARPPLPLPRNELEELYSTPVKPASGTKVIFSVVEEESHGLGDLGFIAEALEETVEKYESSLSASATKDKWETFDNSGRENSPLSILDTNVQEKISTSTILQPTNASSVDSHSTTVKSLARPSSASTASSRNSNTGFPSMQSMPILTAGATTPSSSTALAYRTNAATATSIYMANPRTSSINATHYFNTNSVLRPIPQEGIASSDFITNPFYSGSINAGNYPPLVPLPEKPAGPRTPNFIQDFSPGGSRTSPPNGSHPKQVPAKPQPYSGSYGSQASAIPATSTDGSEVNRRDSYAPFLQQRLPSLGSFDPFADFMNSEGEAGGTYVVQNPNTSPLQ